MAKERGLTLDKVRALTPEQIRGLTLEQVKALTPEQIKAGRAVLQAAGLGPPPVVGSDKRPEYIRAEILARARRGEITPEQAEAEWKPVGWGPLAFEPSPQTHDPLKYPAWTLSMVLVWIVTRDLKDVMWFDDRFRVEVKQWEKSGGGWELVKPSPMTVIIAEMVLEEDSRVGSDYDSREQKVREARADLKSRLSEGLVTATAVVAGGRLEAIPAHAWPRLEMCMDLNRDYLGFEHNFAPVYWRALLPRTQVLNVWRPLVSAKARGDAKAECTAWLQGIMADNPKEKTMERDDFIAEAGKRYKLSPTAAKAIWTSNSRKYPAWSRAGRKRRVK